MLYDLCWTNAHAKSSCISFGSREKFILEFEPRIIFLMTFTSTVTQSSTAAMTSEYHNFGAFKDWARWDDSSDAALPPRPDCFPESKNKPRVADVLGAQQPQKFLHPSDPTSPHANAPEVSLPFIGYTFKCFDNFNSALVAQSNTHSIVEAACSPVPNLGSPLTQQESNASAAAGLISKVRCLVTLKNRT